MLYQKLPVENDAVFQEILNLTQILSIYQLEVNRIQYNSFGEAALYMGDLEVILGNNVGMNGKIAELSDMLPNWKEERGLCIWIPMTRRRPMPCMPLSLGSKGDRSGRRILFVRKTKETAKIR